MNQELVLRQRQWNHFHAWEATERQRLGGVQTLRVVGEWVEFYLRRHRRLSDPVDVRGIQALHNALSFLSKSS